MGARRSQASLAAAIVAIPIAGCATADPASTPTSHDEPVSLISAIVVGDSLAAGGVDDALEWDPGSWTENLDQDIEVIGGWRRDGATTAQMAQNLRSAGADALIMIGGTNDVHQGVPATEIVANLHRIVDTAQADLIVVGAIPPSVHAEDAVLQLNAVIETEAVEQGWIWLDPWTDDRIDGEWRSGSSPDGVHASSDAYQRAGASISRVVIANARRDGRADP